MKKILLIILIILALLALLSGCNPAVLAEGENSKKGVGDTLIEMMAREQGKKEETVAGDPVPRGQTFGYFPVVDGLHVTGNPVEVDIVEYRLEVTGEVEAPLSLTFDEIKDLESSRIFAELVCPETFKDEGYWTGARVDSLLELAKVKDEAVEVHFISLDGGYSKSLKIEEIIGNEGLLIAYHYNDEEFPEIHGYPLRIVAKDYPGYLWVKWLGKIEVTTETE